MSGRGGSKVANFLGVPHWSLKIELQAHRESRSKGSYSISVFQFVVF